MTTRLVCFLGLMLLVTPVSGQGDTTAVLARHRNECRLAGQVLRTGHPHTRRVWAEEKIRSCTGDVAVAALIVAWRSPAADSLALMRLYRATHGLQDGELFDDLLAVAESDGAPDLVRITALGAVASQLDPRISLDLGRLRPIEGVRDRWNWTFVYSSHASSRPGVRPLPAEARATVGELAARLAHSPSSSGRLRDSARQVLSLLEVESGEGDQP